jgi:hypothetical protein
VFCAFCNLIKNKYYSDIKGASYTRDWLDAVSDVWDVISPKTRQENSTIDLFEGN